MGYLFIFGLGYCASHIRAAMEMRGWRVMATGESGELAFADEEAVRKALRDATHVLSSVPPGNDANHDEANASSAADPVLARYGDALSHGWLGYLSSTGVYGDTRGAWVDESAPVGAGRRSRRAAADKLWLEKGARVFRLPGIYGPGRSALDRVTQGRARRIDLPGQVFSRVHVDDIVAGVLAALDAPAGAYNLADDLPASQNAVIEEACRLLGQPLPPLQTVAEADLSPMARAFYTENRRVANGKAKRVLGWQPRHADFRQGLRACHATRTRPALQAQRSCQ